MKALALITVLTSCLGRIVFPQDTPICSLLSEAEFHRLRGQRWTLIQPKPSPHLRKELCKTYSYERREGCMEDLYVFAHYFGDRLLARDEIEPDLTVGHIWQVSYHPIGVWRPPKSQAPWIFLEQDMGYLDGKGFGRTAIAYSEDEKYALLENLPRSGPIYLSLDQQYLLVTGRFFENEPWCLETMELIHISGASPAPMECQGCLSEMPCKIKEPLLAAFTLVQEANYAQEEVAIRVEDCDLESVWSVSGLRQALILRVPFAHLSVTRAATQERETLQKGALTILLSWN